LDSDDDDEHDTEGSDDDTVPMRVLDHFTIVDLDDGNKPVLATELLHTRSTNRKFGALGVVRAHFDNLATVEDMKGKGRLMLDEEEVDMLKGVKTRISEIIELNKHWFNDEMMEFDGYVSADWLSPQLAC
jgi:hypothetical protein